MSQVALASNASGTGTFTIASPNSNTNRTLTLPDQTGTVALNGTTITSGTAVASTSGTSIDFTSLPSWIKRVTVMFSGVSTNGTSGILVQLGDSGGVEITGYVGSSTFGDSAVASTAYTTGFGLRTTTAAYTFSGQMTINLVTGLTWVASGILGGSTASFITYGGNKTLSDTLTQIRITTVNGTDTFDAGSINILYEG
jgi:hypothetical protein